MADEPVTTWISVIGVLCAPRTQGELAAVRLPRRPTAGVVRLT